MSSFRQQLKQFFAKTFKGYYLTVTTPKKFLIDCGVPDLPIVIRPSKLKEKMEQHDLTKDDLKNLGTLINSPLMVFHSQNDGRFDTAFSIITEREGNEGLLCVILYINEVINKIEVNNIASIHFRNINSLIKWTEDGYLIDSDIDKTKKIFSDSWHNASKCEYLLSLLDDAKVKHNSELAKNNGKNLQGAEDLELMELEAEAFALYAYLQMNVKRVKPTIITRENLASEYDNYKHLLKDDEMRSKVRETIDDLLEFYGDDEPLISEAVDAMVGLVNYYVAKNN